MAHEIMNAIQKMEGEYPDWAINVSTELEAEIYAQGLNILNCALRVNVKLEYSNDDNDVDFITDNNTPYPYSYKEMLVTIKPSDTIFITIHLSKIFIIVITICESTIEPITNLMTKLVSLNKGHHQEISQGPLHAILQQAHQLLKSS